MDEYKFWNNGKAGINNLISADIRYVFNELKECLESINIKLSHDDIMRAYDVYLRFNGFMPDPVSTTDVVKPKGINCTFFPCIVPDPKQFIDDGSINISVFAIGIRMINDILPEKSKFEDIDMIVDNVGELFHQFSILTNDIIRKGYSICNSVEMSGLFEVSNAIYSCTMDCDNHQGITFSVYKNDDLYNKHVMSINSSILAPINDDSYVMINFFPKKDQDSIKEKLTSIRNNKNRFKRITAEDIIHNRYRTKHKDDNESSASNPVD